MSTDATSPRARFSSPTVLQVALCAALGLSAAGLATAQSQPAAATAAAATAAAAPAADPRFDILEFEIEGNTVLPVTEVERAVMPFMGERRSIADVEAAREALEKRYQQAGFLTVFVDVPEQRVDGGLVRLRVIEGRVERLRVTGARYFDQGVIRERVHELAPGRVPDFNEVQRQLAGLSREERQIQPLLRPGLTPGTVEAELKVADQLPAGVSLELNNRHSADTKPLRASLNLRYDNLWQREHSIALSLITAPEAPKQSKLAVLNYSLPLGRGERHQDQLLTSLVWSDSLLEPLGATTVIGKGVTLGLRWSRSLQLSDSVHSLSLGGDYKNVRERLQSGDSALSTPLRYLPLQLSYSGSWFEGRNQTSFTSSFTFAARSILQRDVDCPGNIGPVDQFECKRFEADGSFAHWRGDWRTSRSLQPLGLPGSLGLRLGWQMASQPLVSGEQFALGGAETVRGYLESEATGDQGLLGSLEWRSPNLGGAKNSLWRELSLLAFVDVGRAYVLWPLPEQTSRLPLLGSGLGLRVQAGEKLRAELDLAWPQKPTARSPKSEPRLHVRLSAQL
ncbi:MAG: ShlB/FhaC/HecB family hemolysin secretion/activation protein [Roseateles sp.]